MSAEENKAIVRRYFEELWNKGDLAFIEECMGPDVLRPGDRGPTLPSLRTNFAKKNSWAYG